MNDIFKDIAEKLVEQMTLEEAGSQLRYNAPAIERLGIPDYNWWNEGLHGLARSGTATVFPQAIGLAAMFDRTLLERIADVVSTEARARYNESIKEGDRGIYKGITLWSPNINIFRDPRWGRGQETYGEDPYLTGELGIAFIKGLQGNGKYLKTAACAKHFAVHSGPEAVRHSFNAEVSEKDLAETYLPAFEKAVKKGHVETVMGAYNRTNGEPCCGSVTLLDRILRKEWGFDGHVVSDCWAIRDFHEHHMVTNAPFESVAMAINAGCDLNCGDCFECIQVAVDDGLVTEEAVRNAAVRIFTTRARLGMFAEDCEYDSLGILDIDTKESRKLSYEASCRSIVMLKNDGILPLDKDKIKTIAVIGPTAASIDVLNGNYNGTAAEYITNLQGIVRAAGEDIRVIYAEGSHLYKDRVQNLAEADDRIAEAVAAAKVSDVVILSVGLDASIEGEEGDTGNAFAAGDKVGLFLPDSQRRLIRSVAKTGKPIILINNTGSAMDLTEEEGYASAILQCWYSGEYGGLAVADTIFGRNCPSGKLPVTFYKDGTLPDFTDYSMKGRTYRYLEEEPLYPFGFGLSYSKFDYDSLETEESDGYITVSVNITNTGCVDAEEVTEVYIAKDIAEKADNEMNDVFLGRMAMDDQPRYSLAGFARNLIKAGETVRISIPLEKESFETVLTDGMRELLSGKYIIYIGGSQPDELSKRLTGSAPLNIEINI